MSAEPPITAQQLRGQDNEIVKMIKGRILKMRSGGFEVFGFVDVAMSLEWTNVWENYLHAVETNQLSIAAFDEMVNGYRGDTEARLKVFGGWSDKEVES